MLQEAAYHNRMLLGNVGCELEEAFQLFLIGTYVHGSTRKHIRRSYQYWETYASDKFVDILHRSQCAPFWLVHTDAIQHSRELFTVFCIVDVFSLRTKNVDVFCIQTHSQVVRNLTTCRYDDTIWIFEVKDIHHTFECQLVEVKTVAHIVVGRNGFRIVVDHDRTVTFLADSIQCLNTTPVKFNRRSDTVSTRTENDYRTLVIFEMDIVTRTEISHIKIVGLCRIFCCQGINLLNIRYDTGLLTTHANQLAGLFRFHFLFHTQCTGNLEVGKALNFGLLQQIVAQYIDIATCTKFLIGIVDVFQMFQEPLINLGQFINLVNSITLSKSLFDHEDSLVGWFVQSCVNIVNLQFLVVYETMHALTDHTETLLDTFFESTTDRHHFTNRLHRRTDFTVYTTELAQVPSWQLTYNIVQCWFKECGSSLGNRVLQIEETVTQAQLGSNESEWIASSLRSQS
ncbi:hypothetical protein EVA_02729 [gut metagenome]|uniref:Uncharacterized protein n=1 Tax=gut metagenome TaxID=749906 RepID=J9H5F9_9ZZZZ